MEEVGYAEPTYQGYGASSGYGVGDRLDTGGYAAVGYDAPGAAPGAGDSLGPLMERAIGEQIAEQRMIREALAEFDRRLEALERTVAERLVDLDRSYAERLEHFERATSERMVAFETVLKRVVDRLTGAEERLLSGLEHNDKVMRVQLDALRPAVDAAAEMLAEQVEHGEAVLGAKLEALRPTVEAAVLACVGSELERTLDEMRASLAITERKVRRDVNRIAHAVRGSDPADPFPGFDPVDDEVDLRDDRAAPPRKRARPLRARRAGTPSDG